jgi:hypothetical protein
MIDFISFFRPKAFNPAYIEGITEVLLGDTSSQERAKPS